MSLQAQVALDVREFLVLLVLQILRQLLELGQVLLAWRNLTLDQLSSLLIARLVLLLVLEPVEFVLREALECLSLWHQPS